MIKSTLMLIPALLLSGCGVGNFINGSQQNVIIDSFPHTTYGVSCLIENERGSANVTQTPQTVEIARAYGPLSVKCRSTNGDTGSAIIPSLPNELSQAASVLSGPVSVIQDVRTGSLFSYPSTVVVNMTSTNVNKINDAEGSPLTSYTKNNVYQSPVARHHTVRHVAHRKIIPCACK